MSFVVMTDTSGNLPPQYIFDYSLQVIPFSYFIDGKEYNSVRNPDFNAEEYYARIKKGMKVTTSQIPPQQYADFFEPALREGKDVIFICMSSGISGSCNSAKIAARMMMEAYPDRIVEVIDTRGASLGEGIIALYADRLRRLGRSTADAIAELYDHVERMFNVFTVDDLMHLRRGGRLSNLSAVVGTVLQIKPPWQNTMISLSLSLKNRSSGLRRQPVAKTPPILLPFSERIIHRRRSSPWSTSRLPVLTSGPVRWHCSLKPVRGFVPSTADLTAGLLLAAFIHP